MKYGRVVGGVVAEIFTPPVGFVLADCFTPEIAAQFKPVPDVVQAGWIANADGTYSTPPITKPA